MTTNLAKASQRLRHLATFLRDKVPNEKFDFRIFGGPCNTIHCAAGWIPTAFKGTHLEKKALGVWKDWPSGDDCYGYFDSESASKVLGLSLAWKRRAGEGPCSDFDRLFLDADNRLAPIHKKDTITREAVIARIEAAADAYEKRGK